MDGEALAKRLEDADMLDRSGEDWYLPRHLDHDASRAEVEAKREAKAASRKRGGQSRARREAEARGDTDKSF